MTGRLPRVISSLVAIVVVAGLGASLWSRASFHEWPWQDRPDRVHACGRDFEHADEAIGAGPFTKTYVVAHAAKEIQSWPTLRGKREVWASSPCGTGVYVRTGSDRFLGYGLLGGP